jgi:transcriptional regulator with XRE-family HTH domain
LKTLRRDRDISQVELAEKLQTYQTVISAIERGVRWLTLQQVVKMADALGVSPAELLGPSPTTTEQPRGDRRFARRLEKIGRLPKRDQQALLRTIDAFLSKVS